MGWGQQGLTPALITTSSPEVLSPRQYIIYISYKQYCVKIVYIDFFFYRFTMVSMYYYYYYCYKYEYLYNYT
jgi:hypothetical protein